MRLAPLAVAIITGALVLWMVSFGPRVSRLYAEETHAAPYAATNQGDHHGTSLNLRRRADAGRP